MQSLPDIKINQPRANGASDFSIGGMTCNNCARHVREAIQTVPGVHDANVTLENRRATVRWKPGVEQDDSALDKELFRNQRQRRAGLV